MIQGNIAKNNVAYVNDFIVVVSLSSSQYGNGLWNFTRIVSAYLELLLSVCRNTILKLTHFLFWLVRSVFCTFHWKNKLKLKTWLTNLKIKTRLFVILFSYLFDCFLSKKLKLITKHVYTHDKQGAFFLLAIVSQCDVTKAR